MPSQWWWPYHCADDCPAFECEYCEDDGCPLCCEPVPLDLQDLELINDEIAAFEAAQGARA